jgi:arylformamidase
VPHIVKYRDGMTETRRTYDISVPIRNDMVVYEGDPDVRIELAQSLARGDMANVTRLDMGAHTGTHIDAPAHFIEGGAGVDAIPLDVLTGRAQVVDATHVRGHIDAEALAALPIAADIERVLFKTTNSRLWDLDRFSADYIALAADAADRLAARGVKLVGIDYLSIAPKDDAVTPHRTLLEAGVIIVEGLDLREVPPGAYELICLPLRIVGRDGAPARAILRDL